MRRFGLTPEALARLTYPQTMVFLGSLAATLTLLSLVVRMRATYRYDLAATLCLQRLESPLLTKIARGATFLGNATTVVGIAVLLFVAFAALGRIEAGILVGLSLFALPLNAVLKSLFSRQRPGEAGPVEEDEREKGVRVYGGPRWGFSFPSGHSMASSAFYGTVATMGWLLVPGEPLRSVVAGGLVVVPFVCGISRIYLGAHWLSDVVAGWTGGALVALAASALYAPLAFPG